MRNITLSAEAELIDRARHRAELENTTLNSAFREWLQQYGSQQRPTLEQLRQAVAPVSHFRVGRRLTREERNER